MSKSIFEAAVVRGELPGPTEAFQAFTERLLPLATMERQNNSQLYLTEAVGATPLASKGVTPEGDGGHSSPASGGTWTLAEEGSREAMVVKGQSEISIKTGADAIAEAIIDPGVERNSKQKETPLFSVSDVAAITEFVSGGLYRHFALYRMCFTVQPAKVCREVRIVQVETPLTPPPLRESEEAKPA